MFGRRNCTLRWKWKEVMAINGIYIEEHLYSIISALKPPPFGKRPKAKLYCLFIKDGKTLFSMSTKLSWKCKSSSELWTILKICTTKIVYVEPCSSQSDKYANFDRESLFSWKVQWRFSKGNTTQIFCLKILDSNSNVTFQLQFIFCRFLLFHVFQFAPFSSLPLYFSSQFFPFISTDISLQLNIILQGMKINLDSTAKPYCLCFSKEEQECFYSSFSSVMDEECPILAMSVNIQPSPNVLQCWMEKWADREMKWTYQLFSAPKSVFADLSPVLSKKSLAILSSTHA